jgi:hypothetical protein
VTTALNMQQPRLVLTRAVLRRTDPASICFCLANVGLAVGGIVDCIIETKRGLAGHPHSLPRRGWGYSVDAQLAIGVVLVESAGLWTVVEPTPVARRLEADRSSSEGRSPWSMFFAGMVTYRSASQAMFQTAFHRRLDIRTNEFSS